MMTRRTFMGSMGQALGAAALAGCASTGAHGGGGSGRPNIIVILADDMGFSDLGCYGSEIDTPNLDAMAADGLRFTQFYCAARCCPSRASLLTGLYPHQTGVGKMVSRPPKPYEPGPYQGFLNGQCVTIAEALGQAGYRTYLSGKWHVGERPEHWPRKRGFDRCFSFISGASSYWQIRPEERHKRDMAIDDEPFQPELGEFYMTDAFSDYAVRYVEDHAQRDDPFFLYLAYTAPHWPLHAWPEDIEKYRGRYLLGWDELRRRRYARQLELGIIDPDWDLSPRDPDVPPWDEVDDKEDWAHRMAVYAAMVDRMDQGIGRVMAALRATGQDENTLVLFLSDNGGCHESVAGRKLQRPGVPIGEPWSFAAYRRPWANASNTPFRMFKHWIHEGGIATPLIARWPKGIQANGALTPQTGHIIDILPTCLDLAGAEYPCEFAGRAVTPVEGKSLAPVLGGGRREPHDALYWEHYDNRGIRAGKWKLVAKKTEDWELYDLEADRTELHDLSAAMPDKAAELNAVWTAWADRVGV